MVTCPPLVGADLEVPLVTGGSRRYVNLDVAASAPALASVHAAVNAFMPWYSSVHRGAGYKSMVATEAYEGARRAVRSFFNARPDDTVIFTRNTTDGMNLLRSALPDGTRVVLFETEHHANLLPWQGRDAVILPAPASPSEALARLDQALYRMARGPCLVAMTGASNVTGELWPVREAVDIAHRHGARVVLDAAQLAPHRPVDVAALGVDYLAMSGHKLYAPYGAGVLLGRADWLGDGAPFLAGGGAVEFVMPPEVLWADLPDRQEAGSPNVVGAVALGVACATLRETGMGRLAAGEDELLGRAWGRLAQVPGLSLYTLWGEEHPRIGVLTFNLDGYHHAHLAAILSAEYGIGVRHGCFCAHPLMLRLLQVSDDDAEQVRQDLKRRQRARVPGAVRASFGLSTTGEDIDWFLRAIEEIARHGPRWSYRTSADGKDVIPDPDPRGRPRLPFALAADPVPHLSPA